jgi:hypothetical protein
MQELFTLDAFVLNSGARAPFVAKVLPPEYDSTTDDWACQVEVSPILASTKKIFGLTQQQASDLAFVFLRRILEGHVLVDENGGAVSLPLSLESPRTI